MKQTNRGVGQADRASTLHVTSTARACATLTGTERAVVTTALCWWASGLAQVSRHFLRRYKSITWRHTAAPTVCPQGTYGYNCSMSCTCSYMAHGNRCNPVNGACLCTSCFTSANCSGEQATKFNAKYIIIITCYVHARAVTNGTTCLNKYLALDNAGKVSYMR